MKDEHIKVWDKKYSLIENKPLGGGGNAKVYKVRNQDNNIYALKVLTNFYKEPKQRFVDEIKIMLQCKEISGILPILDYSKWKYQYVMPIAQPITDVLHKNDGNTKEFIKTVVSAFIQLSQTLSELHQKNIAHRDIKPANLYYYNNCFCFGDFGLVEFPESNNDLTRSNRALGAIFTMAPEMKRNPKHSDGKKADVYSLAKTLWIILSGEAKGFEGVYNFNDKQHGLRFFDKFKKVHLVELEDLLKKSTSNIPDERPTIQQFKSVLENYLSILDDDELSQKSDWEFLNKYLFPFGQESAVWRNVDRIIEILNIVGTSRAYNHMLLSSNGGLDFKKAERAYEENCIYIYDDLGLCYLVKPKCLIYESFGNNYTWNYFLLELDELPPIISDIDDRELLIEDYPGNYVSTPDSQYGVYDYDDGTPLPKEAKEVVRYLKGKFLFVLKYGQYNGISATYDGRHDMCTSEQFRKYIIDLIHTVESLKAKGYEEEAILNCRELNKNPFAVKKAENDNVLSFNPPQDYITSNYEKWCFYDCYVEAPCNSVYCKFAFEFNLPSDKNIFDFLMTDNKLYLCTDGYIKPVNNSDDSEIFYVFNRETAISIASTIVNKIKKICTDSGYEEPMENLLSIKISKLVSRPKHIFTKDEIKEAMIKADDRVDNQLVVDENGYVHIIQELRYRNTYPVALESWDARNCYVGKYSKLSTLDDNYIMCLQGWLSYLKRGSHIKVEYLQDTADEEMLLKEIKKYY